MNVHFDEQFNPINEFSWNNYFSYDSETNFETIQTKIQNEIHFKWMNRFKYRNNLIFNTNKYSQLKFEKS